MPAKDVQLVHSVRLVGRAGGAVKNLPGFKKGHHTVPDAVTATTSAFFAKICVEQLAAEAEAAFQKARELFGYKRKQVSLEVSSPTAVLTADDFTAEWAYALADGDPANYVVEFSLREVRTWTLLEAPPLNQLFPASFSEIGFALRQPVSVEAFIDAVEAAAEEQSFAVEYPSDYRECTVAVPDVTGKLRYDGAELRLMFPRNGSPRELLDGFAAARSAFALSKHRTLAKVFAG
jgi:hypothetical protein